MASIRDIVEMIRMIGPTAQRAASGVHKATERIKKDVESARSAIEDFSPNRDRSRDTGSKKGKGGTGMTGPGVTTTGLGAALQSLRRR